MITGMVVRDVGKDSSSSVVSFDEGKQLHQYLVVAPVVPDIC